MSIAVTLVEIRRQNDRYIVQLTSMAKKIFILN